MTSSPPESSAASSEAQDPQRLRNLLIELLDQFGMLLVLGLLVAACAIFVDHFAEARNLSSILDTAAAIGIVACTMLFCLASGNVDLSVGTVIPCAGVVAAIVTNQTHNYAIGIAAALAAGAIVRAFNGTIIAFLKVNPLITTLATMQMVKGFTFLLTDQGRSVGVSNDSFTVLGMDRMLGVQNSIWMCVAFFVVFGLVLARTTYGRNTLAIGGNEEAARLAGVPVRRTKIVIFAVQGIAAACAGVLIASKLGSGVPKSSEGIELEIIAACVLGGVSLNGGIGRISYVVAGVLIMGVVQNAMNLKNIDPFWQYVVRGAILLTAIIVDRLKPKR